ncbi:pentatricopeptide repeat-containing protein At2g35030, mitochondrial-like [Selaginella moellendorffii]|uniref:pentatricopeptide repeat-containing protein At2g35030, mitochondrial-like n=1 Tax=Selaginella moellendorffii TaxID=88036 RepID=UPI000D1C3533|nr:pentatricopeptide repeat-containing protein At2g35030, mitochondrial-like [Selaginella moellendorffii]|eukprot:XP_024532102.1 pentatricopeptide repeat-containing protein At2g35030, mitochondrial-like [Selaginella moellendorffii]
MVLISSLAERVKSCRDLSQARDLCSCLRQGNYLNIVYLANLVVEMYGKCGSVEDAKYVFDHIRRPNLFSWTMVIAAYARNGHPLHARELFDQMPMRDLASWNAMILVCADAANLDEAIALFESMQERDLVSWSTMITAYARFGYMDQAKALFDQMPQRNVVVWTAMVAAYAQNGHPYEARKVFDEMPETNLVSWNIVLDAFAENGESSEAADIFRAMPQRDAVSWNTLIAACVRRGQLLEAKRLFDRVPEKSVPSWNSIFQACAVFQNDSAVELLSSMRMEDVPPDGTTFTWILSSCNSRGDLGRGLKLFSSMIEDHGLSPCLDHYNCVSNALGRAGLLRQVREAVEEMPLGPDCVTWKTLLLAASKLDYSIGTWAATRALELNPMDDAPYVSLSQDFIGF